MATWKGIQLHTEDVLLLCVKHVQNAGGNKNLSTLLSVIRFSDVDMDESTSCRNDKRCIKRHTPCAYKLTSCLFISGVHISVSEKNEHHINVHHINERYIITILNKCLHKQRAVKEAMLGAEVIV